MKVNRRVAVPLTIAVVLSLVGCAPGLPETVVPGSVVTVGWTQSFTSGNASAAPTPGNLDVAAMTRSGFGEIADGEFVADAGFGSVTIVSEEPFTVRYDLTEPRWSDDIPLDAADLLLGWAVASGFLDVSDGTDAETTGAGAESTPPRIDEFARAIEVTYPQPIDDWQNRIMVSVPAHGVARIALGVEDPMEAKQALITAIRGGDAEAMASIAEVWSEGFAFPESGEIPAELLISSGPFRVTEVTNDDGGQSVTLAPNTAYRGDITPQVEQIRLVPPGDDPITAISDLLDIAQVAPVAANRTPIDDLERQDFSVITGHDGTVWALVLKPAGIFTQPAARAAFIRAIPARALVERGGGEWSSAYTATTSMLSAPGTRAYDIVSEDSGFAQTLTGADDPAAEREAAGIAPGAPVCVLYDRASEFAVGAFAALRDAVQEAGWVAVDCGADDVPSALDQGTWDAVITRVSIPQTAKEIAAQWGSTGEQSLIANVDGERDTLIAQFAQTTDLYESREVRAQIEATIVRAGVALPLAVNPTVTIVDKDVTGVSPPSGATPRLTTDAVQWAVVP